MGVYRGILHLNLLKLIFAFGGKYMYNYNKFYAHSAEQVTDVDLNTAVLPNATATPGGSDVGASPTI